MTRPVPRRTSQRAHHDELLRKLEWRSGSPQTGRLLDAIIVPAARRAQRLRGLIDLAAHCGTTLVVIASHDCDSEEVATLVARTPGSGRAVIVDVPYRQDHDIVRLDTSGDTFRALNGERSSNLSLKRNLGLLLARLRGWQKIMFMDDDISGVTPEHVARVGHYLDTNPFAGLKTVKYPDNSVVCHANRLTGRPQGIFVSGAALGVNTATGRDLEVFPDVYNEDWFAMAREAASAGVVHVGDAGQLEFNPFENPQRAVHEEFGDLIAEGLYALFNDGYELCRATEAYWRNFIDGRHRLIEDIQWRLAEQHETHQLVQAAKSLQEALFQLDKIRAADCTAFLEAWQSDRQRFASLASRLSGRYGYEDAFAELGLANWQEARFGVARMPAAANAIGGRR